MLKFYNLQVRAKQQPRREPSGDPRKDAIEKTARAVPTKHPHHKER
jgi:hypothetical protein